MSDKWLITSSGQLLFFCLLCVSILLVSCERRDLTYYEVSEITLTAVSRSGVPGLYVLMS